MGSPVAIHEDVFVNETERNPWGYMEMPTVQEIANVQGVYGQWAAQPVVLQVKSADLRVPLRGVILGETRQSVRFRVDDSWDIDIYKTMILAVEEESWMDSIT
jgi:type II secretory pathway component PulC